MTDHISPDPDPIRHSAPSGGGESPAPEDPTPDPAVDPTPPDGAPEDPTPPDAPVGEAAGISDEELPEGTIPEADGGIIITDVAMGGEDTVAANDLLDGAVDRGN